MTEALDARLVRRALELLEDQPAERVSLRRVAQSLGVSHQAPYVHFGSKRRFLAAVGGAGLQQAADRARSVVEAAAADPLLRLHALLDAYLEFIRERPFVHDLAFGPLVAKSDHPALQRAAADHWDLLHDTVAACQPPRTSEADVLRRCAVIWGTVYGVARLEALGQIPASVPADHGALPHQAVDTLHHGWQDAGATEA